MDEASRLAGILLHPKLESLGEVRLTGEAARALLGELPYEEARVLDWDKLARADTNPEERARAAGALGGLGGETAVRALISALGDPSGRVVDAVLDALDKLGSGRGQGLGDLRSRLGEERPLGGMRLFEAQLELERLFGL